MLHPEENTASLLYATRDKERFYDYPPVLSDIDENDVWEKRDIQLYIHIPFCLKQCHYCPYFKVNYNYAKADEYINALILEFNWYTDKPYIKDSKIDVVYVGGGTPGCLSRKLLARLLSEILEKFNISENAQITIELNPSTVTKSKLELLKEYRVNRISIGVQSFDNDILKFLGRTHMARRAVEAVETTLEIGFQDVNIDLLYKIPNQTPSNIKQDLNTALSLGINHISLFGLNIKPKTKLFDMVDLSTEEPGLSTELKMIQTINEILTSASFHRYSIDAFCKNNHKNRYQPYLLEVLGLGAGAFSHINGSEYNNCHDIEKYIRTTDKQLPVYLGKKLTIREEIERYMVYAVFNLKLEKKQFKEKFGIDISDIYQNKLNAFISDNLMIETDTHYLITDKGFLYIFNISKDFFSRKYKNLISIM